MFFGGTLLYCKAQYTLYSSGKQAIGKVQQTAAAWNGAKSELYHQKRDAWLRSHERQVEGALAVRSIAAQVLKEGRPKPEGNGGSSACCGSSAQGRHAATLKNN
jgi:hypothetical protein